MNICVVADRVRSRVWEPSSRQAVTDSISPFTTRPESKDAWTAGASRWPGC